MDPSSVVFHPRPLHSSCRKIRRLPDYDGKKGCESKERVARSAFIYQGEDRFRIIEVLQANAMYARLRTLTHARASTGLTRSTIEGIDSIFYTTGSIAASVYSTDTLQDCARYDRKIKSAEIDALTASRYFREVGESLLYFPTCLIQ